MERDTSKKRKVEESNCKEDPVASAEKKNNSGSSIGAAPLVTWSRQFSKSKQKYYWYNSITGKSQWAVPESEVVPVQVQSASESKADSHDGEEIKTKASVLKKGAATKPTSSSNSDLPGNIPSGKKNFFFSAVPPELRKDLQLDQEAMYSVTNQRDADSMSKILLAHIEKVYQKFPSSDKDKDKGKRWIITDGTACVGGNVISFAKYFDGVNAVEIDQIRFDMLARNVGVLGLDEDNKVQLYQGNYVEGYRELRQDIIFMDPPWGGPSMMSLDRVRFPLGGVPLRDLCESFRDAQCCKVVALKLSPNYDIKEFEELGRIQQVFRDFRKMILVLIEW
jgi:hypothetical protein